MSLPDVAQKFSEMVLAPSRPAGFDRQAQAFVEALSKATPTDIERAMPPMLEALARVDAPRAGPLALFVGAMVEGGGDASRAGAVIAARIPSVAATAAAGDSHTKESLKALCRAEHACLMRSKALRVETRRRGALADFEELSEVLSVLDDEEMVVFHPDPPKAFAVRVSGVYDNFQLQTLLNWVLIRPEHPELLSGVPPDPTEVWAALGGEDVSRAYQEGRNQQIHGHGRFNLVAWDGSWIWGEGKLAEVPRLDGVRVVRLEKLPYERSWTGTPYFPAMPAEVEIFRIFTPAKVSALAAQLQPVKKPS